MKAYKLNIDFGLLGRQKQTILELMLENNSKVFKVHNEETMDSLNGLLGLIDEIQDQEVDVYGAKEKQIFNLNQE